MCTLIEESNVTAVNLSLELEQAVIQHRLQDDKDLYINEDDFYPFWIRILNKRGLIGLSTHTLFKKSVSNLQRLEFCNKISSQCYMVTAYTTGDDKLKLDYSLSYRDGLLRETFIRTCRQFSRNIKVSMRDLDPDNEIVLLPGQSESEAEDKENE